MPPAGPARHRSPWRTALDLVRGHRRRRRHGPTEGAMLDHRVAGRVLHVVVGAEPEVVVLLRRGVHPPTLVAGERALLVVGRDEVLPQLGTTASIRYRPCPIRGKVRSSAWLRCKRSRTTTAPNVEAAAAATARTARLMPSVFPRERDPKPTPHTQMHPHRTGMVPVDTETLGPARRRLNLPEPFSSGSCHEVVRTTPKRSSATG